MVKHWLNGLSNEMFVLVCVAVGAVTSGVVGLLSAGALERGGTAGRVAVCVLLVAAAAGLTVTSLALRDTYRAGRR